MSTPSQRLAQLGLELPPVAAPVAAYQPAARLGNQVVTSGQLPFVQGTLTHSGKVGAEVSAEDAKACARLAGLNALAAAASAAGGLDRIASVAKLVVFVASDPAFTGQPQVANGASELIQEVFGTQHARSAVGVSVLPLDAPVEVELIAELA